MDPLYIEPGSLRHSITIQAQSTTRDSIGQLNAVWNTVLTTRAAIESTSSQAFRFSFQGNVLASNSTDLLVIRYPKDVNITPGMQVLVGSQTYVINFVDDVSRRHRKLTMACTAQGIGSQY